MGTTVCGTDVASFVDPHSTIHNPDDWTYTGLAKGLHLTDGAYYVTVQVMLLLTYVTVQVNVADFKPQVSALTMGLTTSLYR